MRKLDFYWKRNRDWWYYDENLNPVIKEDAPIEAKISFLNYKEQTKSNAL